MLQNDASQAALNASGSTDARNDVDALPAGSPGPATGNVISGSGTLTGATGADAGVNVTVVAIQGDGGGAELTPASAGPMEVQGRYGTLTIDAQGNYSYVRNAGTADGVQDVFTYTITGPGGARDAATLTILLTREGETVQPNQIVQTDDGVVILPAGVELSDIRVVGRDLVITLPDGSTMTIPNGAVFVPQLVIGDVEVPPANLAALLIDAEPKPASGTPQMSSGGNFAGDVPPLDPGVPLGDLLPPTEMEFPIPDFEEVGQVLDREPEVGPNPAVQLDDEVLAGGIAGGNGDVSPDTANTSGTLSGSGGDGPLTWDLLDTGAPSGFTYVNGPNGSIIIRQGSTDVIRIDINAATGAYTVTQLAPISHPTEAAPGTENDVSFTLGYTVTDRDGDFAVGSLTVNVDDDSPSVTNVQTGPGVTLDETNAAAGNVPGSFPLSATSASAAISATLAFGADLAALANSTVYALSLGNGTSSQASGLQTAVGDHAITLVLVNSTTIQGQHNGTNVAFTIVLNANGTFTVTQNVPLEHTVDGSSAAAHDDTLSLAGLVNATVTITDRDGDSASGSAPIGAGIVFRDDGPTINVSIISEREPTLLTQDAETIGDASDTAVSSANFNAAFGLAFTTGADGGATPTLAYALDVTGYAGGPAGVDSGLNQGGSDIFLYEIGGKVVGSTSATLAGVNAGNTVFDVAVSATGVVTLTQYSQIDHPAAGDPDGTDAPFDDHIVWMADSLVTLTASSTVTDNDGDFASDSETINIGANLRFADDGPDISAELTGTQIRIDETDGVVADGGEVDPVGGNLGTVTMTAASLYTVTNVHTSADSPTTYAFALTLSSQGVLSGLQLSTTNEAIRLWNIGGTIYGSTSATEAGVNAGNTAFTVSINGSGDVTLTQFLAVEHGTPGASHDEDSASLNQGALSVTVTATDFDGDTDEASVDLGSRIVFEDDGPSITVTAGADAGVILQTDDPQTIGGASDTAVSTANFSSVFGFTFNGGSDGAAATPVLSFTLDVTGYTGGPAGVDSGLNQTGNDIFLYEIGGKVVGSTSATLAGVNAGNTVFDVAVSATGVVTLTQYSQIDHVNTDPSPTGTPFSDHLIWMADNLVTLTASSTVTDNDGDTASDSETVSIGANLRFSDDGPDISVAATTTQIRIDETDNVVAAGGETDAPGGNLGTVTMTAASLYTVTNVHTSADAPTNLTYALTLSSQGVASGLLLSTTNAPLFLYNIGGIVYASTSATEAGVNLATNVAFTVSINGSGDVTVTQYLAVEHGTPGASHDEDSSAMASGLINVSVTATDFDNDTDVASVDIGSRIIFEDDGPSITVAAAADTGVILTTQDADTIGTNTDTAVSSANFGGVFSVGSSSGGSDGTASISALSYTLDVAGFVNVGAGTAGVDSGLNQTGNDIFLYEIGGKVVGSTSATLGGVNAGNTVFDVAVSATGVVTLTQYSQIDHPIADDPSATAAPFTDQLIWMADSLVTLTASATITDNDGDTATDSETVNIGANLRFVDHGPIANDDVDNVAGEGGTATGNVLTAVEVAVAEDANATDGVADVVGADTPGRITFVDNINNVAPGAAVPAGSFVDIAGQYGTLRLYSNGDYVYTRNDGLGGGQQEQFTYTLTDADGDTATATLTISIDDAIPSLVAPDPVQLDDDNALSGGGNPGGTGDDDVSGTSGTLVGSGGDGDLDYFFAASQTAPAGFTYNVTTGATTQTLTITQTSTGLVVATITLTTETGAYTVVQNNPVQHDSLNGTGGDDTENNTPNFNVAFVARDVDNDPSNTVNMVINFDDDTPVLSNVAAGVGVTLDETTAGTPAGFPISAVSATAAITATQAFGADGAAAANSVVYGLSIVGDSPELTTLRTAVGDHLITLVQIDANTIQGQYNGTNVAFQIDIGTDGKVTLTQYVPLEHTTDGSSAAAHDDSLNLSGFVNATITITDKDGDSTSASAPIGNLLVFKDDGPDAQLSGQAVGQVVLDETRPEGGDRGPGQTAPTGTDSETINFGANFVTGGSVDYGADGAGSVSYAFVLSGASVGSGLYALQGTDTSTTDGDGYGQGDQIMLSLSGNVISGKVGTTTYFTITLDPATGIATFTQLLNIWHPTPGTASFDELVAITTAAASDIKVVQTVTDSDGDFDTAEINVGQGVFAIEDDGPQAIQPQAATVTNTAGQSDTDVPLDDDGSLVGDFGTDLPGKITFANIAADGMPTAQKSNNVTIELWLSADGQTLQGRTGSTDGTDGTLIYTVQIQADGTYDFTLHDEIDNGSGVSFSNLSGGVAGNPPFKLITEPGVALELLATPINAGSVNSDSDDIAVDSQFIDIEDPDAGIRFDFGDFTYVPNDGGTADDQFIIVDNETVNGFKFTIDQISLGTTVDIRLRAIDADTDGGVAESDVNTGDPTGDPTDPITMVKIYNTTGTLVATLTADGAVPGTSAFVDFEGGGTVLITDLPSDYSVQTYTVNGYSRLEITNAGIPDTTDGKFSLSQLSIETTQQGNPIDLFFDIAITDADGDTIVLDDAIHVNVDPVGTTTSSASAMVVSQEADSESFSMLASTEDGGSDMQMKSMNAANTNTMLLGAIAAAGIVEAAAAAEGPAGDLSTLSVGDELAVEGMAATSSVAASDSGESRNLLGGETQEADSAADLPDAASRGQDVAAEARSLADAQSADHGAPTDLLEGTDSPAAAQAPASAPAEVAMPAADVLAEVFGAGADAGGQHTQELGRILADALGGGGNGPNLEAVIDAAGGKAHGARDSLEALATMPGGDVPAWDMGAIAGFTNGHAMSMEAMMAHPDAPAQNAA